MSIDTTYFEEINRKDSNVKKKLFQMKEKLFSSKPDVIQIGIGGYSSSGKTVLIDAMFSFFDTSTIPAYMPKNHAGVLLNAYKWLPAYKSHSALRSSVDDTFHTDNKTIDKGEWDENTYCTKLCFGGKEKILLVRNIPGEMFELYFKKSTNDDSLKVKFNHFINQNKKYKKEIQKLYKFQSNFDNTNLKNIINEIRTTFFNHIKLSTIVDNATLLKIETNFYAFLFYYTSDINVYCIKSEGLTEDAHRINNDNIRNSHDRVEDIDNFIICYTQFDRILSEKKLPDIAIQTPSDENAKPTFKEQLLELFGAKKQVNSLRNGVNNEIINYWLTMNKFYIDIENRKHEIIDKTKWDGIKDTTDNGRYNWFITSVAYNFNQKTFFDFQNQTTTSSATDIWNINNNKQRTPIGVLEVLLYILRKKGFKENNWKLALTQDIKFSMIRKKIGIK